MQKHFPKSFADQLTTHAEARGLGERRLAKLTNLPRYTMRNWLRGVTKSPRQWQDILRVAQALCLDFQEVEALLAPTKHPPLQTLWQEASIDEKSLFARWDEAFATAVSAPFLAPAHIPYFVGRQQVQQQITHHLLDTTPIVTIQGMGGVGKTTLATQLAYALRPHFPDGILWANMDGANLLTILNMFAIAYGEDATPFNTVASRSQFVRTLLDSKRALIILDNIEKGQQIEPLLPPTNGNCRVLITTRHHDLSIVRGWPRITLQPFDSTADSLALFAQLLDIDQINQTTLTTIAQLLGNLPLAIAIVAGRLAYEPNWSAEHMLAMLQEQQTRLNTITDEGQSVRLSFDVSYQALPTDLQTFFLTLSLFASTGFSLDTVNAITNTSPEMAQTYLTDLVRLSLVQKITNGRYALHPLMRTYAHEKFDNMASTVNYVTYFVQYVTHQQKQLPQLDAEVDNILNALDLAHMHNMDDLFIDGISNLNPYLALRGLDTLALPYIKKAQHLSKINQKIASQALLASYEGTILEREGHFSQAEDCYQHALAMAYRTEETKLITVMLQHVGRIMKEQKQFDRAHAFLRQSLQLAQEHKQDELICNLYNSLGSLAISHYGDYPQAQELFEQGLHLAHQISYHRMVYFFSLNLGGMAFRLGNYAPASQWFTESLSTAQQLAYPMGQGIAYRGLSQIAISYEGDYAKANRLLKKGIKAIKGKEPRLWAYLSLDLSLVLHQQQKHKQAHRYLTEGVTLAEATEDRTLQILAHRAQGILTQEWSQAIYHFEQALGHLANHQDAWAQCQILLAYGQFAQKMAKWETAVSHFTQLQPISQQNNFPALHAEALYHLAHIAQHQGELQKARQLGQDALTIWQQINHSRASEAQAWLTESLAHHAP